MNDWTDLINLINKLGAKIDSSGLPHWVKWFLLFVLVVGGFYLVIQRFWVAGATIDKSMDKTQVVDDIAMKYEITNDVKNESDSENKVTKNNQNS